MGNMQKFNEIEPLERLPSSKCFNVNQFFRIGQLGEFTVADTSCGENVCYCRVEKLF